MNFSLYNNIQNIDYRATMTNLKLEIFYQIFANVLLYSLDHASVTHSNKDTRWHCRADIHIRGLSKWTNEKEAKGSTLTSKSKVVVLTS